LVLSRANIDNFSLPYTFTFYRQDIGTPYIIDVGEVSRLLSIKRYLERLAVFFFILKTFESYGGNTITP